MPRLSFRQSLVLGFLLVALLLGAAALRGLLLLEDFASQSRAGAALAVQVTADIQHLAERSVDLERGARQYLVLKDAALRERFVAVLDDTRPSLVRLAGSGIDTIVAAATGWQGAAEEAQVALQTAGGGEAALAALARLGVENANLADAGRQWIDRHNATLLQALEQNRFSLFVQVLSAIAAALILGAAIGWWAVRPVAGLEAAIEQLGAGRFDAPIAIRGPVDLERLGRRLDWLRQRLAELEADRVRVLRHVSHELKTPLAALREGVALLQEQVVGPLSPDQQEVAGILEHNTRALQRQIEDLLNYHATVFDAGRLVRKRVPLQDLLLASVEEQRLQLQAGQVSVRVDAGRVPVTLDPEKLRVVLGNLLSNAIAFSPPESEIRLVAKVADGLLTIDCIDAGPGVADEDVERIFEPFVQGGRRPARPGNDSSGGSGIGLSIVRELVAAQGGRVFLVPAPLGAHFRMELPHEN